MKMKKFGLTETKLFHFHRIFKNGNGEVVSSEPFLDPPLGTFWQTANAQVKCHRRRPI